MPALQRTIRFLEQTMQLPEKAVLSLNPMRVNLHAFRSLQSLVCLDETYR